MQASFQTVDHEALRQFGRSILARLGVSPEHAKVTIDSLVEADLRGVHSHGMQRLPWYAERLSKGATNPKPRLQLLQETEATALVDGDAGLGQVISQYSMSIALEKARRCGVGSVTVRNSHHFGACAYWAEMALPYEMIGIAITNGGPIMGPWGGLTPTTSNNPIGVAIPAKDRPSIILDMALSAVAGGALDLAARQGEKIPHGWALDKEGNPTDDPVAGRLGLLLPIGGYKGYGLAVVFEVLTAVLSGANFGRTVPSPSDLSQPMNVGHCFQAIQIASFMAPDKFKERVDEFIGQIKSSRLAPGVERTYLPGEIEHEKRARYLKEGIPLLAGVVKDLQMLAQRLGILDLRLGDWS